MLLILATVCVVKEIGSMRCQIDWHYVL